MVPLADGFPGKQTERGVVPHPIFGTYLLRDMLTVFDKTGQNLEDARKLADAAISRMRPRGDALIFWYGDDGLSQLDGTHYSGLTQARYLQPLISVAKATGEAKYFEAARRVFQSLKIPASEGGVHRLHKGDSVVEEYAGKVPTYVLNGWTTAILELFGYATSSGDQEAQQFALSNVRALKALLPLYDVPDLANSRYQLVGSTVHRFRSKSPIKALSGFVRVGEDIFPFEHGNSGNPRWTNQIRQSVPKQFRLNTLLSRAFTCKIVVRFKAESDCTLRWDVAPGRYQTQGTAIYPDGFTPVKEIAAKAGLNTIVLDPPWESLNLIGYPTNFRKVIAGKRYNVYHWLHVRNLERLFEITHDFEIEEWAHKWRGYARKWPELYPESDIAYSAPGAGISW
ncbi:MAG: D-glucuronyl C5-epimerase family protein [Caulobacteraceae bacterium]|nr:D-glucuronyl C5-epimerase family protein [Caulobacteraceae bacterium]